MACMSLEEFYEKNVKNDGVLFNYTILGNCSRCGNCCSDLLHFDEEEIDRIDKYLEKHRKIIQHNKGKNNINCPFRNDEKKICEIYEVRPYICRVFKCDTKPEDAINIRDIVNKNKKPRSMAELFFKDKSKIKFLKKYLGIKIYRRGT